MADRSPGIGLALLIAPTMCVVALRFGLPILDEAISNDYNIEVGIHATAIIIGVLMFLRYRVVEDHEYHRSAAIKRLTKSYSQEDKGLWNKGDIAIEKLESAASIQQTGKGALRTQTMLSGSIGSMNAESPEVEVEEDIETEVVTHLGGINTLVDLQVVDGNNSKKANISDRLDTSAANRLEKQRLQAEKKAEKQRLKVEKAQAKAEKKAQKASAQSIKSQKGESKESRWNTPVVSTMAKSVVSCNDCGTLNNSGDSYCSSCGSFLN
ncbi:MAG: hypothetical protein CMA61_04285 [Euryarchaeota archaeon]|jgi:hypothetical protein|nr:hypothetical protein [Euryarchaeota archaeon]|tara:strand:- start:5269 stop:6069 length:801 start_codon:yes stop_codon:yes gene_type:complete